MGTEVPGSPVLGTIERVDPRFVWPNEAVHFTPWLKENLGSLGKELGLELEGIGAEVAVGPFSADIVGHELSLDVEVVVENQLEPTDHDHLGKLITYSASLDAGIIVWVAASFREEHRQALDWLNQQTPPDIGFFGVEIEVFRINGSPPAPHFKPIAQPNEFQKLAKAQSKGLSPRQLKYRDFWISVVQALKKEDPGATSADPERAGARHWYNFSAGRSGFAVGFAFTSKRTVHVELYIGTGDAAANKFAFDQLLAQKDEIEQEFGESLVWNPLDAKKASRISVEHPGDIEESEQVLAQIRNWGVERVLRMQKVMNPRVKKLSLTPPLGGEAELDLEEPLGQSGSVS